jgi:alpha-beta hydrolase superfamily lysophospholipase
MGTVPARPLTISTGTGPSLAGYLWPAPVARGVIAIVHGLGEHAGRYAAVAGEFVAHGYSVAGFDWPGHGASPGRRGDASWDAVRDRAIPALLGAASRHAGGLPVCLLGHSMGGAMVLDYALARPSSIAAVVAIAPAIRTGAPPPWKLLAGHVLRLVAPHLGIPHGLPPEALSRDREVVSLYRADPLVQGAVSARLYFALLAAQARVLNGAAALAIPALLAGGTADRIVDWTGARDFAAAAPASLATFIPVEGAYHEVLNDEGRDAVLEAIRNLLAAIGR